MPVISCKRAIGIRQGRDYRSLILLFIGMIFLGFSFGCGPPSGPSPTESGDIPEITDELIQERINFAWVREVPDENGVAEPITWRFRPSEKKEITVVEKEINGKNATLVLDIKTQSSSRSREQRRLAGQIRTKWELQSGWALRTWEVVDVENISMKYVNLPKLPDDNSNR